LKKNQNFMLPMRSNSCQEGQSSNVAAADAPAGKESAPLRPVNFQRTDTAARITTATAFEIVAEKLGMSVAALKRLGQQSRTAEIQKSRCRAGKSVRAEMSAAAKIITGELPPVLQPKRSSCKQPEKPGVLKEAKRIASQYDRDKKKGIQYDDDAMSKVRASWTILQRSRVIQLQRRRARPSASNFRDAR